MRVLVLYQGLYDTVPGQRFRIEQWEPLLRGRGVEMTFAPFVDEELQNTLYRPGHTVRKTKLLGRALARRHRLLRGVRDYDAVFIFREAALLGPPVFERMIARSGVPFVFDFDDAIFEQHAGSVNPLAKYVKNVSKTATICHLAAHVTPGNEYLAEYARRYNHRVTVVPTTIDTDRYTLAPVARCGSDVKVSGSVPVIGWSGSHSTLLYLDMLRPALTRLAQTERFRLRVISSTDRYRMEGVDTEGVAWRADTEVDDLRPLDIGLMPLPDDRWTRGKCGAKALQYMALGIPAVCSPVGVNSTIIGDGDNGMLADTEDEWVAKLRQLLRSPELRRKLGAAGRETVVAEYSAAMHAPRVYEILNSIVGTAGARDASGHIARGGGYGIAARRSRDRGA